MGIFEHFYDESRFGAADSGTHYVVLAYKIALSERPEIKLDAQHSEFIWIPISRALRAENIHPYAKAYLSEID
jgi:colanic acid biosynthesis protein WcaH